MARRGISPVAVVIMRNYYRPTDANQQVMIDGIDLKIFQYFMLHNWKRELKRDRHRIQAIS